jgi:hypothetical protein
MEVLSPYRTLTLFFLLRIVHLTETYTTATIHHDAPPPAAMSSGINMSPLLTTTEDEVKIAEWGTNA